MNSAVHYAGCSVPSRLFYLPRCPGWIKNCTTDESNNSLGIDTPFSGLGTSPMEVPGFAPGLLVLGSVPSIIRCWLNDNFKHDSLLYAAVCTGSHGSYLDERLVTQLGYSSQIRDESDRKIEEKKMNK